MDTEKAKKIIEDILKLMGAPAEEVLYSLDEKRGHIFIVKSAELQKLSLEREDLIKDLVFLLKRIFNKNSLPGEENFKCTIDINDEQSKSDAKIKMKALNAAEEARNLKTDVTMEPMSSYERMVVHSTLAGMADISTESIGIGKERRLKVRYLAI
jgi:spoIIIJ-associated protein